MGGEDDGAGMSGIRIRLAAWTVYLLACVLAFIYGQDTEALLREAARRGEGEPYYPENHELDVQGDISGCLHEQFHPPKAGGQ